MVFSEYLQLKKVWKGIQTTANDAHNVKLGMFCIIYNLKVHKITKSSMLEQL
jgi:hypothetical protein